PIFPLVSLSHTSSRPHTISLLRVDGALGALPGRRVKDAPMLRRARPEKRTTRRVAAFAALSLGMAITGSPGAGEREIDLVALIHLVHDGQGAQALERVADLAASRGGWAPAPGDLVVFDPGLPWWVRGSVLTADLPPADCAIPRFSQSERCVPINAEIER